MAAKKPSKTTKSKVVARSVRRTRPSLFSLAFWKTPRMLLVVALVALLGGYWLYQSFAYAPTRPGHLATSGPCAHLYEVRHTSKGTLLGCTHGMDPAPKGTTLGATRTLADYSTAGATVASSGVIPCYTDGVTGNRVQAVYVSIAGQPDNFASVAPYIKAWASYMNDLVQKSAAETGGSRNIKFVTNPDCSLNIQHVTLTTASLSGDPVPAYNQSISEMYNLGYNRKDRIYEMWVDYYDNFCGMANTTFNDSASSRNPNNTGPNYARIDQPCWGNGNQFSELHELFHALGSVQLSAPHSTGNGHCTDESDDLCYQDSVGVSLTYPCDSSHENLLDCNHDDYFSTNPPQGSYLGGHWNTANSSFLFNPAGSTTKPGGKKH